MAIQDAQAPGAEHYDAHSRKKQPDNADSQSKTFARETGNDEARQVGCQQNAGQNQRRTYDCEYAKDGFGLVFGFVVFFSSTKF